jgi:hypothetical protein
LRAVAQEGRTKLDDELHDAVCEFVRLRHDRGLDAGEIVAQLNRAMWLANVDRGPQHQGPLMARIITLCIDEYYGQLTRKPSS